MGTTVSGTFEANGNSMGHSVDANIDVMSGFFMHADGTFGGGTVKAQFKAHDGTWRDLANTAVTANASKRVLVPNGSEVRLNLSGATSPNLYYQLSSMSIAR